MIRPSNRVFWLLIGVVVVALAVLIVRPLRQWFGAAVWDAVLVPFYASSPLLMNGRGLKRIPILGDIYVLLFNDAPSVRVALLLINRIHEASYFGAQQEDPLKMRARWTVSAKAAQALAAHVLAGPVPAPETRLIAALLYDDLHSQSYVMAAHTRLILPRRVPVWREQALALYREARAGLPAASPWAAWIALRVLWLDAFTEGGTILDWGRQSIIEEQFWRLTELAEDERSYGIAIAAAQRFATDLVALITRGGGPGAPDLLRFGTDLGYWIDSVADGLRATVWHSAPSSRASELPPATFLAGQLIPEIAPKWSSPGEPPSDALRAQLIAARGAIYTLIQGGWQGMVQEPELEWAWTLTQRAIEEVEIEDEFGGRA